MKHDETLTCKDCRQEFVWTQGEQKFYKEKNLTKPTFCPICRARHQARDRQFAKYKK